MSLSLGEVLLFLLLLAYGVYFFQALRVRELALQAARHACSREDAQLLDESVSMQRLSMSRDERGSWRLWRQYRFDYTIDGENRRQGHVMMLGLHLQALVMAEPTLH